MKKILLLLVVAVVVALLFVIGHKKDTEETFEEISVVSEETLISEVSEESSEEILEEVSEESPESVAEHVSVTGITLTTYDVTLNIGNKTMPIVTIIRKEPRRRGVYCRILAGVKFWENELKIVLGKNR